MEGERMRSGGKNGMKVEVEVMICRTLGGRVHGWRWRRCNVRWKSVGY